MANTGSIPTNLEVPVGYCVRRKADNTGWEAYNPATGAVDWADVQNKPATFAPEAHTHPYEPVNANIQAHIAAAHAPSNAQAAWTGGMPAIFLDSI